MKFFIKYLKPFKNRMALGFAIKVSGTVAELFLPYILTHILDNVIVTLRIEKVVFWGIVMIICAAAACAGNIIANRMAAFVSRSFAQGVRSYDENLNIVRDSINLSTIKNENGEEIPFTGEDDMAKCLCHEIDHLDGILIVDREECE